MKDPKRLVLDCTAVEGAMLRSASVDVPPPDLHESLNAALLLGVSAGAVGVTATAASHVGAAPSVAAMSTAAPVSTGVSTSVLAGGAPVVAMKWVALAVVGGALSMGVRATLSSPAVDTAASTKTAELAPQTTSVERRVVVPTPSLLDRVVAPAPPPTAARRTVAEPARPVSPILPSTPARTVDDMPRELAVIDQARSALTAGDATRVVETLDRYDLDFPKPQLAAEALALRIEAYALRHDRERVRELASTFLATYPSHPLVTRIRTLASEGAP